jgi:hypothetical protein
MKFARKPLHRAKVPKESRKIRFIKKVGRYTCLILNNPSIQGKLLFFSY